MGAGVDCERRARDRSERRVAAAGPGEPRRLQAATTPTRRWPTRCRRKQSTAARSCIARRSRLRAWWRIPGCYATSIILALAPLLRAGLVDVDHGIVCDAKSGVSGAGKAPTPKTHFMYAADNLSAYTVFGHRHTGELLEQLGLTARADPVHAASAADPARHSFDDLCAAAKRRGTRGTD